MSTATMDQNDFASWLQVGSAGGLGALMMAFFAKLTFRKMAEEGAGKARADAETDVVELMRVEIARLRDINDRLQNKLDALRQENLELREEIADLRGLIEGMKGSQS